MLGAIATVLMLFEIPLPFAPPFYEIDFSEVPVLIGCFAMGPLAGVAIEAVKILLNFLINGTITGGVGELSNFMISVSYVIFAGCMSRAVTKSKDIPILRLIGIMLAAMGVQLIVAVLCNEFIMIPLYGIQGDPADYIMMGVVPFNLTKTALSSTIFILIYKGLIPKIKRYI
jgi:riboflavin transporter FmnP